MNPHFSPTETRNYPARGEDDAKASLRARGEEQTQCLILAPHGANAQDFLKAYPKIEEVLGTHLDVVNRYLEIEKDTGSIDLAEAIAQELSTGQSHISAQVISVLVPRGILDANRIEERAIRNIFDHKKHPGIRQDLLDLHRSILQVTKPAAENIARNKGVFVEVHSMAPYSRSNPIGETPDNLVEYIESYMNQDQRTDRRKIDLVTFLVEEARTIAYEELTQDFERRLSQQNYPHERDKPYPTERYVMSSHNMEAARGVTVDVPKDFLSLHRAEEHEFQLDCVRLSQQKIDALAKTMAQAIADCLNRSKE